MEISRFDTGSIRSDDELIAAVRAAVAAGAGPSEVERLVGRRAWINTLRQPDDAAAAMVDVGPDEEHGTPVPRFAEARHVVYWGRATASRNPRIVGITWDADGVPGIFFGVIYPP